MEVVKIVIEEVENGVTRYSHDYNYQRSIAEILLILL